MSRTLRTDRICTYALGLIALALFVTQLYGQTEPVPVTVEVHTLADAIRLYVLPAIGTLLMGLVAILLEWIRRTMTKTNAANVIVAANARSAAVDARQGRMVLEKSAAEHSEKLEQVHEAVNGQQAELRNTISNLKAQLRQAGIEPQDG